MSVIVELEKAIERIIPGGIKYAVDERALYTAVLAICKKLDIKDE